MFCYVTNIPLKNGEAEKFSVCCVNMCLALFAPPLLETAAGSIFPVPRTHLSVY